MDHSSRCLLPALLLLATAAVAPAQDAEGMLKVAYSLRRQGDFRAAGAAFEEALDRMPRGEDKKAVALEAAELFRVTGRLEKALWIFRRNHDVPREIEVLLEMGKEEEALTVSRLVDYPKGEALALARLDRVEEALEALEPDYLREARADLLREEGRHEEAASLYASVNDYYRQAGCLWEAGLEARAREAYEDARIVILDRVRHESLDRVERAKRFFEEGAETGVERERARLTLADAYGALADDYVKLATLYRRTGRERAPQLFENAKRSLERQRDTLLDEAGGGGDAYGREVVEHLGLAERIAELERKVSEGS